MARRTRRSAPVERDPRQVEAIAQGAARLMAEDGIRDFAYAKRKAAEQLGLGQTRSLPSNTEIERALVEYQRLFRADSQPQHLRSLREHALNAMELLGRFEPRLVGPVLTGTADNHYPITLHLFTDPAEEVGWFLEEQQIPYELDSRRVKYEQERAEEFPLYRFIAGNVPVELTVFPYDGLRQAPLSPVDGKPMRRANTPTVAELIATSDGG